MGFSNTLIFLLTMFASSCLAQPHVIVIGVDGLSVGAFEKADIPNLRRLMKRSAWSLTARGVLPTWSSPNWVSMISGAGTEQHGITSNGMVRKMVEFEPVCQSKEGTYPNIFDALHEQRPSSRIAVFHEWKGFAGLIAKSSINVLEHEHSHEQITEAAIRYWTKERPSLMFVHLGNVDHAGHENGWGSPAYNHQVAKADKDIGALLNMLDDMSATESTYVLVTSDHGGTPRGHGKNSLAEIQIPWIMAGPGLIPGQISARVTTFDTAATLAWIFGLEPLPCAIGRPVFAAFQSKAEMKLAVATNE